MMICQFVWKVLNGNPPDDLRSNDEGYVLIHLSHDNSLKLIHSCRRDDGKDSEDAEFDTKKK